MPKVSASRLAAFLALRWGRPLHPLHLLWRAPRCSDWCSADFGSFVMAGDDMVRRAEEWLRPGVWREIGDRALVADLLEALKADRDAQADLDALRADGQTLELTKAALRLVRRQ